MNEKSGKLIQIEIGQKIFKIIDHNKNIGWYIPKITTGRKDIMDSSGLSI